MLAFVYITLPDRLYRKGALFSMVTGCHLDWGKFMLIIESKSMSLAMIIIISLSRFLVGILIITLNLAQC